MFRTELNIPTSSKTIKLNDPVFTIGSCFSTMLGDRLDEYKFNVLNNPFGTSYNPVSIFHLLERAIGKDSPREENYLNRDGTWFHHDFHATFYAGEQNTLQEILGNTINECHNFLKTTQWLIITLGTAVVYQKQGVILNNCHKVPQKFFEKRMLSVSEITASFKTLYQVLSESLPDINIVFTVSPVRHIKDTIPVNSLSKSILQVAVNEICHSYDNTYYFPSYEMMMDDLRDYRFYKDDLIHPTPFAENYIWEKFRNAYMDQETNLFVDDWQKIQKDLHHKPFQPTGEQHQKFLKKLVEKLEKLPKHVNVAKEIELVKSRIIS